ncbi:hypothetical protein [Haliea sp. E17]|uniref:hypothetical protein n=1 Tax=Haliea sp. E17 TaxID=3401576 RepID=UPI003AAD93D2
MGSTGKSVSSRLKEELYRFAIISAYLFVCFFVVMLYGVSQQGSAGIEEISVGLALVKALVMGKFILIGEALSIGRRGDAHPIAWRIAWKSLAMLLLLIVFKILEEIIVGWFHDRSVAQVYEEFSQLSAIQMIAPTLMMLLVLVPLIGATELLRLRDLEKTA